MQQQRLRCVVFSQSQNILRIFGAVGLSFISAVAVAKKPTKEVPLTQVLGVQLHLELRTIEDYERYQTSMESNGKTLQQYFGDSVRQTLKITGTARFDDMTIDVNTEIPQVVLPSMKAVDLQTDRKGNRVYHMLTPKFADYDFLGNNKALKAACFQHMDSTLSVWRSQKRTSKKDPTMEIIVPDQAEDVFSTAESFQGYQLPKSRMAVTADGAEFSLEAKPGRVHCRQVQGHEGRSGAKRDLLQCVVVTPIDFYLAIDDRSEVNLAQILANLNNIGGVFKRLPGSKPTRFADFGALAKEWAQDPGSFRGWAAATPFAETAHSKVSSQVATVEVKEIDPATLRPEDCRRSTFFRK